MIKTIFPVNILVKDHTMPESFSKKLSSVVQSIRHSAMLEKNISKDEITDNEVEAFTEENLTRFPELATVRDMIIDGFYDLACSFEENILTKERITEMMSTNRGKLPLMKKGDYQRLHGHANSVAFAIFYLSDVDNEKVGGELILKDPSFHSNSCFHPTTDFKVETKKNRLVVAPSYVWHEVTPYLGDEDRIAIVVNLEDNIILK